MDKAVPEPGFGKQPLPQDAAARPSVCLAKPIERYDAGHRPGFPLEEAK